MRSPSAASRTGPFNCHPEGTEGSAFLRPGSGLVKGLAFDGEMLRYLSMTEESLLFLILACHPEWSEGSAFLSLGSEW